MIETLAGYIGRYRRDSILTPAFTALEVVMEVLIPFTMAEIIDKGIMGRDMGRVCLYGAIMLALAFVSLYCGIQAGRYAASASAGFAANLREGMYAKIQGFSFSNIDKYSTAGLVTRMTTDVTNVQNAFQMIIRVAVRAPVMMLASMSCCLLISPRLSLIFFAAVLFLGAALTLILRGAMGSFRDVFRKYDDLNASVQENVSAIRVVKAYVREEHEGEKFERAADRIHRLFVKAESFTAWNSPIMMLTYYGCIVALSWFGARNIVAGGLSTGNLTSMFSYMMGILMSLMMLTMVFVIISISIASGERISEVLHEVPGIAEPEDPVLEVKDGSIDFNHVGFAYRPGSGESALQDIDLHVGAGETLGIVGGTGSGKSSLVNLISRLYDVNDGSVEVGGVDVRRYDTECLRNQVAVVLQKSVLFSGTILDNLRWGKKDATEEECREACRLACADEFIERLPDGYDTWIEQGGANVSGGQRQRLCIARALLKNPRILILDDSTSAVDTATDARIQETFATKFPGTTKLIIAQRISSLGRAERVAVMKDGRIDAVGTQEELRRTSATFREICEAQAGGGDFDRPQPE